MPGGERLADAGGRTATTEGLPNRVALGHETLTGSGVCDGIRRAILMGLG